MRFSDETLMAYADGELGEPERSAVEAAERNDPAVAEAIARHRALRADVFAAFAGVLDEPVPARLQPPGSGAGGGTENGPGTGIGAANGVGAGTGFGTANDNAIGTVTSLAAARERKAKAREAAQVAGLAGVAGGANPAGVQRRPSQPWPRWGALAASLAVGVLAGSVWLNGGIGGGDDALVATDASGRLLAQGELAGALAQQLAGDAQRDKRIRIGISFAARDGGYCRSFSTGASAGLACRDGDTWRIPVLRDAPAETSAYRQAGSTAPAAVLEAIDERIDGAALDAAAERAARDRGWKR